jgi:flavin-dependent dehydrogenase
MSLVTSPYSLFSKKVCHRQAFLCYNGLKEETKGVNMKNNYDVLVVGAGTAGIFFAKRMAEQGFSVLVVDSVAKEKLRPEPDVFHIDKDYFAKYNIPEPKQGDEDFLTVFEYGTFKSALNNYPKRVDYPFTVLRLPKFIQRIITWAEGFGVEFAYETAFKDFVFDEKGRINGAVVLNDGALISITARLVADCSGIPSVARRKLPATSPVENFEIGPNDKFYVTINYVKIKNREDYINGNTGWAYYKAWTAPALTEDTAIFGCGANFSFEYVEKWRERFHKVVKLPEHEILYTERGATPFRRPPYSFVDDGFVCLGDSACLTKPFSGEGVASGWNQCEIAALVAGTVLKDGAYPAKEQLWDINKQYHGTQGADFAYILATVINAVDCSPEENDYEFKKGIVFSEKAMTKMNINFNADMSAGDSLTLAFKVLGGVFNGNIKLKTVKGLLKGVSCAGKLKKLYKKFPATLKGYEKWCAKASKLWTKVGNFPKLDF